MVESKPETTAPYDFSDWQIGEQVLPNDGATLLEIVREALRVAFQGFGEGGWVLEEGTGQLTWKPSNEYFDETNPAFVALQPRDLILLMTGDLADGLSVYRRFDEDAGQVYEDTEWDELWIERMKAIKAWKSSLNQCSRAMHAMKNERLRFYPGRP